jgi:hypothetical protein
LRARHVIELPGRFGGASRGNTALARLVNSAKALAAIVKTPAGNGQGSKGIGPYQASKILGWYSRIHANELVFAVARRCFVRARRQPRCPVPNLHLPSVYLLSKVFQLFHYGNVIAGIKLRRIFYCLLVKPGQD